jgi:hypothetical protein
MSPKQEGFKKICTQLHCMAWQSRLNQRIITWPKPGTDKNRKGA